MSATPEELALANARTVARNAEATRWLFEELRKLGAEAMRAVEERKRARAT